MRIHHLSKAIGRDGFKYIFIRCVSPMGQDDREERIYLSGWWKMLVIPIWNLHGECAKHHSWWCHHYETVSTECFKIKWKAPFHTSRSTNHFYLDFWSLPDGVIQREHAYYPGELLFPVFSGIISFDDSIRLYV